MDFAQFTQALQRNVSQVVIGKAPVIELLLVALLSDGHVLIEDVPGIGKTTLAKALARSINSSFARIQFTPDLLPSDVTGISFFNQKAQTFEFRQGPVFSQLLLADEINRATPRTQSALLEAMQEQQVTVDGVSRALPRPFLVLATQNPIEYEGTFPLPEAQLDRFLMRLTLGYPAPTDERRLLLALRREHPINRVAPVVNDEQLLALQPLVWDVHVDDSLQDYIVRLVTATRQHHDLALGASSRATLALFKTAQALAAVRGRDHVLPDDIKALVTAVLAHRLIVRPEAELRGRTAVSVLNEVLQDTPLLLESAASR